MAKKPMTFRLSEKTVEQLESLLKQMDLLEPALEVDKTKIIQLAIFHLYEHVFQEKK